MRPYNFHARHYDPQLGRFWGIDPMDQFPSGYVGMGNNPANQVDPDGILSGPSYENPGGYAPGVDGGGAGMETFADINENGGGDYSALPDLLWGTDPLETVTSQGNSDQPGAQTDALENTLQSMNAFNAETPDGLSSKDGTADHETDGDGGKEKKSVTSNVADGFVDGAKGTVKGLKNLFTIDGMSGFLFGAAVPASDVSAAIKKVPDMTAEEWQYAAGYSLEKGTELFILQKSTPVLKSKFGLPKGLGRATTYTNGFSAGLNRRLGTLPFRVPTPLLGMRASTSDVGLIMSRNVLTPLGYSIGIGNIFYFPNKLNIKK